jgi:hypothetical protein
MLFRKARELLQVAVVTVQVLDELFINFENAAYHRPGQHLLSTLVNALLLLLNTELRKQPLRPLQHVPPAITSKLSIPVDEA